MKISTILMAECLGAACQQSGSRARSEVVDFPTSEYRMTVGGVSEVVARVGFVIGQMSRSWVFELKTCLSMVV